MTGYPSALGAQILTELEDEKDAAILEIQTEGALQVAAASDEADRAEAAAGEAVASAAGVEDLRVEIEGQEAGTRSELGRPLAETPVTGTAVGLATYVYADALSASGFLEYVVLFNPAASSGEVRIRRENKSGNDFTQVGDTLTLTVAPGLNTITYETFGSWPVNSGERLGINAYTGGVSRLSRLTATGDSGGYYDSAGAGDTGDFTDAGVTTNTQLQLRFGLITALPATGLIDEVAAVVDDIAVIDGAISGDAGGTQAIIGRTDGATLVTGSGIGGSTYVYANGAATDCFLEKVELFNPTIAGTVKVRRFVKTVNGATFDFTQAGSDLLLSVVPGLNTITHETFGSWPITSGDLLGFYARQGSNGLISFISATGDSGGYYNSAGTDTSFFSDAGTTPNVQLQLRYTTNTELPNAGLLSDVESLDTRVSALEGGGGSDYALIQPTGFILVWAIGQSNTSGRATTLSSKVFQTGQAYKYVRSSTNLQLLADPTGNDATAASGRGSFGPSLAKAVQRLSNGKIGVIIVNSAEGGTSLLTNWASGGTVWNQAKTDLAAALTDAATKKLPIVGACVYMLQGETDGDNAVTLANYKAAFIDLKSRVDTEIGAKVPFLMTRIGTISSGDTAGYATIRQAQTELTEEQENVFMGHTGTRYFAERGLMMDSFHYVIAGYEEIGESVGNLVFDVALGQRPKGYLG